LDFWIFVFDGPGGRWGLRESWENKPHLQERRFRRVLADFRCFGGTLWRAAGRQWGAARGRGRSASGSRSAAAGPRPTHAVRRWSKPRAAARLQWSARSSRGRRSGALWLTEAARAYPRCEAISAARSLLARCRRLIPARTRREASSAEHEASARASARLEMRVAAVAPKQHEAAAEHAHHPPPGRRQLHHLWS